jgi:hypothetical protein
MPVEQVGTVEAQQVGFEGLGVFLGERVEAQSSPRPSPVSLPYASRIAATSCIVTS